MTFHRLTVPSYFGGLPAGYDLINDPTHVSVGGAGVAAIADGPKNGGPNDGTYFCAFGEDGLSEHVNRPALALSENTDILDDVLRTSIPTVTFSDATAVGAVSTIALTGEIYVGKNGATNNQAQRNRLVRITDQNDNDLEVSGTKIIVTLMHDGASTNVVGTQATGFRTNASVNVSPPIPTTTTYRVWYGVRNNFTNISQVDKGPLFEEQMRVIQNVSGEVRSLLRQIHSETSINQAWDAAFDSTIRSLASAGLNERYRRATLQPAGFVTGDFNVAGAGNTIFRDGPAVTIQTDNFTLTGATDYRDPNAAALKIVNEAARSGTSAAIIGTQGGDIGLWTETEWRPTNASDTAMFQRTASSGPALVQVIPYDIREADFDGDDLLTFISPSTATAVLNPDSGGGVTAVATIQCAVGQHFCLTTPVRTAIRLGVDMLEVVRADGDTVTVIIDELVSASRVRGRLLSGGNLSFGVSAVNDVALRWIQPIVKIGGSLLSDRDTDGANISGVNILARPIVSIPPSILTTTPANENVGMPAFFGAQTGSVTDATAGALRARALEWGAMASPDASAIVDGTLTARGWLNGDGSLAATRAFVTGNATIGGTLVVTGLLTATAGTTPLTVNGDLTVTDDASITQDLAVGDDVIAGGDVVAGNLLIGGAVALTDPERYIIIREDWTTFVQEFTPDLIHADGLWTFNEIADVLTLNNGTPSSKNPGQLEIIGSGGGVGKQLAIYKTSLLPIAFANVEEFTVVVKVNDDPANVAPLATIGLVDNVLFQNGGNDSITVMYNKATGASWRIQHRVGGSDGTHHNTVIAAFTNNQYIEFKLLKNAAGDWDIFVNGSGTPALTIDSADFPTGNCTIGGHFTQSAADANSLTITWDWVSVRALTATSRGGA